MNTERQGKLLRHGCGYELWSFVMDVVNGMVVVNYRDNGAKVPGLLVHQCPRCRQALQLWWDDPEGRVVEAWERQRQQQLDEMLSRWQ